MFAYSGCGCLQRIKQITKSLSPLFYTISRQQKNLVRFSSILVANNGIDRRQKPSSNINHKHQPPYSQLSKHLMKTSKNPRRSYSKPVDEPVKESKFLTIPNVLTGLRMLAAPYIGYLVFCQDFDWALGLFMAAAVTDSVDGWIARNFKGQSSIFGAFIDPLADKVLVSVLTFSLTYAGIIPTPLCVMIILRDIMIMTSAGYFHYKHLEPPKTLKKFFDFENSKVQMEPTQISKYNTFLQLGLVALSMTAPVLGFVNHPYLQAYWYLVGSTTVLSGLSYIVKDKSAYFVK